jgi:hypothetical protein
MRQPRLVVGIAALALSVQMCAAQDTPAPRQPSRGDTAAGMQQSMAMRHSMMMQQSMMMMSMDSLDRRLDSLVNLMNRAKGDQKVAAMAGVINELVEQRRVVHRRMRETMPGRAGMGPPR